MCLNPPGLLGRDSCCQRPDTRPGNGEIFTKSLIHQRFTDFGKTPSQHLPVDGFYLFALQQALEQDIRRSIEVAIMLNAAARTGLTLKKTLRLMK